MRPTFDKLAELPVEIDQYGLERLEQTVSSGFTRVTTVIRLNGKGEEGLGEDVIYEVPDQDAFQLRGAHLEIAGRHTLRSFSGVLDSADLFPEPPAAASSRHYRRWAFESAALDLALLQNGLSLAGILGRETLPVSFVASIRLGKPPSLEPLERLRRIHPDLRFKLDPTAEWDEALIAELERAGCVATLDLKGTYRGTVVDLAPDPDLYRRVVEGFPSAWIEDPAWLPETEPLLAPHRHRITWDAPIHSVESIEALPFAPRVLNLKPSRFGRLESLLDAYDHCLARGIGMYGGGQFELGPGRGQIQYLASLFHADGPNDVAPGGYNAVEPSPGLPASPLRPAPAAAGFRWSA